MAKIFCFLCHRICDKNTCKRLETTICAATKRSLKSILKQLASISKTTLNITNYDFICGNCFTQLIDYDAKTAELIKQQKFLSKLVQKAAIFSLDETDVEFLLEARVMELNDEDFVQNKNNKEEEEEKEEENKLQKEPDKENEVVEAEVLEIDEVAEPGEAAEESEQVVANIMAIQDSNKEYDEYEDELEIEEIDFVDVDADDTDDVTAVDNNDNFDQQHRVDVVVIGIDDNIKILTNSYNCNFCEMQFTNKRQRDKHVIQIHKKCHGCDICNYRHKNKYYVILHKNIHKGLPENQCPYCDKTFARKIFIVQHIEGHFNTQNYQCEHCGLRFVEPKFLHRHLSQKHSERQSCTLCHKWFKTKRNLTRHMKLHESDRPRFACEICDKNFSVQYTLKMHQRKHFFYEKD